MIHSFSCENFYSFQDEAALSFVVNDKAPKNDGYFNSPFGTRLSKIETVIGPNASGKTNLLRVLPFLKWLIVDSFNANPTAALPVKSFLLQKQANNPTGLSVDFEIEKDVFSYKFKLNEEKILYEELKITNQTKEKVTQKTLFKREWDEKKKVYDFSGDKFQLPKDFEGALRQNASVVGSGMRLNHEMSLKIGQYWQKMETNVIEAGWIGDSLLPSHSTRNLFESLNFYSENEKLKEEAEKLLARFDLGFETFNIKKEKQENGFSINVEVIHLFNGQKCALPFQYESAGTKQLFILLKTILLVLSHGGIAVLDEFDVNLHPEMIMALYELFVSPETNPHNAQMIFSTHSHSILNELDKYQIVLIEKNDHGSSEAWRLDEVKGVRADDNYHAKYLAGAYGAIPKIN